MSDPLQRAFIERAKAALDMASSGTRPDQQAAAFTDLAWAMLKSTGHGVAATLRAHENPLVSKAAAHALSDDVWEGADAQALAESYLASIQELSILDQVKRYARILPPNAQNVMIASDAVGDIVAEGAPKPVRRIDLTLDNDTPAKAVGLVVLTQELASAAGGEGRRMFEAELSAAVTRAGNQSVLSALSAGVTPIASTGDPLDDLRAGLRAAGPSTGYVVAAPAGDVADLATRVENQGGMSVRGGTFVSGVQLVAVDDATAMTVIPAARLAVWDGGLQIRSARHAAVDMRDTPTAPAEHVSLFQTNALGLLLEREWHLAQGTEVVVVAGA